MEVPGVQEKMCFIPVDTAKILLARNLSLHSQLLAKLFSERPIAETEVGDFFPEHPVFELA